MSDAMTDAYERLDVPLSLAEERTYYRRRDEQAEAERDRLREWAVPAARTIERSHKYMKALCREGEVLPEPQLLVDARALGLLGESAAAK